MVSGVDSIGMRMLMMGQIMLLNVDDVILCEFDEVVRGAGVDES